jgi:hypothetical protein
MLQEMSEEMHAEDIPVEYGGQFKGEVYSSREERKFWSYVEGLKADEA